MSRNQHLRFFAGRFSSLCCFLLPVVVLVPGGGAGRGGRREREERDLVLSRADLMNPEAWLQLVLLADLFVSSIVHPG